MTNFMHTHAKTAESKLLPGSLSLWEAIWCNMRYDFWDIKCEKAQTGQWMNCSIYITPDLIKYSCQSPPHQPRGSSGFRLHPVFPGAMGCLYVPVIHSWCTTVMACYLRFLVLIGIYPAVFLLHVCVACHLSWACKRPSPNSLSAVLGNISRSYIFVYRMA